MAMKTVLKIAGLLITTIIAFLVSWLLVGFTKTISIIIQAALIIKKKARKQND